MRACNRPHGSQAQATQLRYDFQMIECKYNLRCVGIGTQNKHRHGPRLCEKRDDGWRSSGDDLSDSFGVAQSGRLAAHARKSLTSIPANEFKRSSLGVTKMHTRSFQNERQTCVNLQWPASFRMPPKLFDSVSSILASVQWDTYEYMSETWVPAHKTSTFICAAIPHALY